MLQGGYRWPQPAELEGLDKLTALSFRAGVIAKFFRRAFPAGLDLGWHRLVP